MLKKIPKDYFDPSKGTLKLLWEEEWRGLGITQVEAIVHATLMSTNSVIVESWLGTLRGPRTRASHLVIQVSLHTEELRTHSNKIMQATCQCSTLGGSLRMTKSPISNVTILYHGPTFSPS